MFIGQQYLQNVLGYSTLAAGTGIIPAALAMVIVAPRSAVLVEARGARFTLLLGYVFVMLGFSPCRLRAAGDRAAIAAGLADTGADSPVIADSSTEAMPSITVPSPGMTSPASTTTTSPRRNSEAGRLVPSCKVGGRLAAHGAQRRGLCATAALGERLGEVGEHDGQPEPHGHGEREPRRLVAAAERRAAERLDEPGDGGDTAPTSTTNMTGLRSCTRGSSLMSDPMIAGRRMSAENRDLERWGVIEPPWSRARLSSVTFTPGSPRSRGTGRWCGRR